MGSLIILVANLLHGAIVLLEIMILIQVVLSWLAVGVPLNPITRIMYSLVEAMYRPIRGVIPTAMGGVDFTPMIALAGLYLLDTTIVASLMATGYRWAH